MAVTNPLSPPSLLGLLGGSGAAPEGFAGDIESLGVSNQQRSFKHAAVLLMGMQGEQADANLLGKLSLG